MYINNYKSGSPGLDWSEENGGTLTLVCITRILKLINIECRMQCRMQITLKPD